MADEQLSGRDLDLVIAGRIMGFRWFHCVAGTGVERNQFCSKEQEETWRGVGWRMTEIPCPPPDQFNDSSGAPLYSESIEAAMRVVEKMRSVGVWTHIQIFTHATQVRVEMGVPSSECQEWGATAAEAICRCALRAQRKFELFAEQLARLEKQFPNVTKPC